ncbi:mechanosensitive ion channel family protein [Halorubellus sp. JP-L1]|uniref:mechanosensitive ion channel family protein n=1 Tax=Halorubellus sp. JP-L1 TaxID=2715753 RepID=UPI00140C2A62|nr:mechanosensitive ion channel family protein [Halorubellus sp. JP-L1]NHN41151.1 mechanosensitive ion channel family protein [Halorubellus sp. JP-L1]
MLQVRAARRLFAEFFALALDASILVVVVAAIYLPGRYLLVPGLQWLLDAANVDEAFALPAVNLLRAGVILFAAFAGITVSGLASFLAATQAITAGATIAIGFASRDVLGNLVSGAFIVLDPTYNIGDWIRWNDSEGIIEDISFRVTRVHTFDNELVVVPNSELTRNAVTNPAAKDRLRVTVRFEVGEDADLDAVRRIVVEEARTHPGIDERPAPTVVVTEVVGSSIVLEGRFWIPDPARVDFERVHSDVTEAVKTRFADEDVAMPSEERELSGELGTYRVDDGQRYE